VPLTVAGSRLLLVKCKEQIYGMPVQSVERLYRIQTTDIETVNGEPVFAQKNGHAPIPIVSLAQLLGFPDAAVKEDGNAITVAILSSGEFRLAVAVDSFVSIQDGLIQELDSALQQLDLFAGGIILGDGTVSIVLNPMAAIAKARGTRGRWLLNTSRAADIRATPVILVVDDSITTRTLEKSILETKGFRVRLSVDGVDALEQLRQELPDLVIVDIEMPRMDGFALLHTMKQTERLADIPVVLVTSRDSPQDRRRGLALGAEAYIVKQSFDQSQLLEVIDQIL
jgi:two-component system chemotaxis sensor kinase CheA